jgi:hypothetical protein
VYVSAPVATERTLILVKPDAFERGLTGEVLGRFERKGLRLVALKMMRADEEIANVHYEEHAEKPFFCPPGDRGYRPDRGRRRLDPWRVRHRGHVQSRARFRLAGVERARDRDLVPGALTTT